MDGYFIDGLIGQEHERFISEQQRTHKWIGLELHVSGRDEVIMVWMVYVISYVDAIANRHIYLYDVQIYRSGIPGWIGSDIVDCIL